MKKKIFGILALAFILSSCSMVKNDIDFLLRQGKIRAGKASVDYAKDELGDDYFDFDNEDEEYDDFEDLEDNDEDILEMDENGNASITVSYTHLTLPTTLHECRSRWSPYH